MYSFKFLIYSLIVLLINSCGSKKNNNAVKLVASNNKNTYKLGETLEININNKKEIQIDSVKYSFQNHKITSQNSLSITLNKELLGKHTVNAEIFSNDETIVKKLKVTILNNKPPKIYNYKIINTYPHDTKHWTQGLEFHGEFLYESTGKLKESKLLKKELKTGKVIKEHNIEDRYFAEGLTIVGDKIHQLTWQGDLGFTYELNTFKQLGTFAYNKSKEGWGLCYDGKNTIYKSDGTTKIWKLNAETLAEEDFIQVATNTSIKSKFNELEWINGKIYANTWQKDGIAIINPENGAIEGLINLKGIRDKVGVTADDVNKVLNGIAYKKDTDQLFITGKYWDKLFEIEVVE